MKKNTSGHFCLQKHTVGFLPSERGRQTELVYTLSVFAPFMFQSIECEGKWERKDAGGTVTKRQSKIRQGRKLTRKGGAGRKNAKQF